MVELIPLQNKQNKPLQEVYRDELIRLRQPAVLERRLGR